MVTLYKVVFTLRDGGTVREIVRQTKANALNVAVAKYYNS